MGCRHSSLSSTDLRKCQAEEEERRRQIAEDFDTVLRNELLQHHPLSSTSVARHSSPNSLWLIVSGNVYDVTDFQHRHPAGASTLLKYGGRDATEPFNRIHSRTAKSMLRQFLVGRVASVDGRQADNAGSANGNSEHVAGPFTVSSPDLKVLDVSAVNATVKTITLATPSPMRVAPGGHVKIRVAGKDTWRSYTPVATDATSITLIVRRYPKGQCSSYLHSLELGADVEVDGPVAPTYGLKASFRNVVFVGGGTGMAPMFTMLTAVLRRRCAHRVVAIGCFSDPDDLLLHDEMLDLLQTAGAFEYRLVFSRSSEGAPVDPRFTVSSGRICRGHLESINVPLDESTCVYCCGPLPFNRAVQKLFRRAGVPSQQVMALE